MARRATRPTKSIRLVAALLALCAGTSASAAFADVSPRQARAAGYYLHTYSTCRTFTTTTVDMKLTRAPGYQWYFFNFFGYSPNYPITLNSDGSITVAEFSNNSNAALSSAAYIPSAPYYRGTAFGGGAYIEAELAFKPATINMSTGWPSWWTMSLEHLAGLTGQQWQSQPAGYSHFIEPDIFEADLGSGYTNAYGGAIHDWFGVWNKTCGSGFCSVGVPWSTVLRPVPSGTDFSRYHRYGMLWVPATTTKPGSYTYYFDGVQVGPVVTFTKFSAQTPVPTTQTPWTFGVVDQQHLVLILGTGASTPMKVLAVNVWQASAAGNMHN